LSSDFLNELRKQAADVARHEAGHYIAARRLGFKTGRIYVAAGVLGGANGGSEIELMTPLTTLEEVADYLERRCQVLLISPLNRPTYFLTRRIRIDSVGA
jgi:hypothetical protein